MTKNLRKIGHDEDNMRLDRWFKTHYPELSFVQLQKLLRTGQIRLNGKRVKNNQRLFVDEELRLPPLFCQNLVQTSKPCHKDAIFIKTITLYEDEKILVLNKPIGLAVQGGSGVSRHVDGLLESLRTKKGIKPRLVHRLDRDTTGVLVIAKTRQIAQFLTQAFKERIAEKTYWAIVKGVPAQASGKISSWLLKTATPNGDIMKISTPKVAQSVHAVSYYRIIDTVAQKFAWLELQPYTGRTHQLRVHAAQIGHPILGDPKYFYADSNWIFPGGLQNKLHLHARDITLPLPDGKKLKIKAPLPAHMHQSFKVLGLSLDGDS